MVISGRKDVICGEQFTNESFEGVTVQLDSSRRQYTPETRKFEDIPPHHIIIHDDYIDDVFWGLNCIQRKHSCKLHLVATFDIPVGTKRLCSSSLASSSCAPPDDNAEAMELDDDNAEAMELD